MEANNYPQIGLGLDKAISCNRVDIWEGGKLESFRDKPLIMVSFPWSSLSFHPTPTFIPSGRRWGEEGMTLEVLLNQAFVCIVQAQGFLICRLSCLVISPHGKRATFSGTDPCCEEVTSDGGLLLYSAASEIARCWGKMQIWDTRSPLLSSFLGPWEKWYSTWWPNAWFHVGMVGSHLPQ